MCTAIDMFDINGLHKLSEECIEQREDIIRYHAQNPRAAFYVSTSGGADSQAMYAVVKRLVPHYRIFLVHAHLGVVEHAGTIAHIKTNAKHPLNVVRNQNMDLIDMVLLRKKFPSPGIRNCTSSLKTSPIDSFIRAHSKQFGYNVVFNCTGLRSDESTARAKKSPLFENKRLTTKTRLAFDWMPVFHLTKQEAFDLIKEDGQKISSVYGNRPYGGDVGNFRYSCIFCVLGCKNDLRNGAQKYNDHYHQMLALEVVIGHTMFSRSKTVHTDREYKKGDKLAEGTVMESELNSSKRAIMPYKNRIAIPVSLSERTEVPINEILLQKHINELKSRLMELEAQKVIKERIKQKEKLAKKNKKGSKTKKRCANTVDWVG